MATNFARETGFQSLLFTDQLPADNVGNQTDPYRHFSIQTDSLDNRNNYQQHQAGSLQEQIV